MALMLLTFGLAGCGGDEPAAVVTPPAPPPAPPPFVPQAVEVALGTSGQTLTLMTTESGGYTFNGEAFATGTDISADNGSTYTLTLDGTTWSAAYKMPEAMSLALGISGENISIQRLEDGSYQFGDGMALTSGMVVTAGNGNMYTVTLGDDGGFAAEYVRPAAQSIPLGASGSMIDVRRNEDGSYSYLDGGQWLVITADSRMSAANGNVYGPLLAPDGRTPVGVMHVAAMQDVALGALGGTLQLTQAEDMTWWLGDMQVMSGHVHTANGNQYVLTLDAAGMWSAVYQQNMVTVALGTQGSVSLAQAEDMSWWLGTEGVQAGSEVMSDSGNTYTLQYADGAWTARFAPESTAIEGTALVAMSKEDRTGYDVDGAELPASGRGDIATSMGSYRVTMEEGMLVGVRLDPVEINDDALFLTDPTMGEPAILPDEDNTEDVNEGMTALVIAKENHPFAALLGSGVSQLSGKNIVAEARKDLVQIRTNMEAILDAIPGATGQGPQQANRYWGQATDFESGTLSGDEQTKSVRKAMASVFGSDYALPGGGDGDSREAAEKNLKTLAEMIEALSSAEALASALEKDGVFDGVETNDMSAQDIFAANKSETAVSYGVTGETRYGAISKTERTDAVSKLENVYDEDTAPDRQDGDGELGAFAFGVTGDTARARYVQSAGSAYYEGGTLAVDQGGTHYAGDISIRVRFATEKVDGLVTNLRSLEDGDAWVHGFEKVSSISLPTANLTNAASWSSRSGNASIAYDLRAGSAVSTTQTSTFEGRLLGEGARAGYQAVGTWSVGADAAASSYLAGGFGAERTADESDERPALDDGTKVGTKLLNTATATYAPADNATGMTALADGKLTVTVAKFGWLAGTPDGNGDRGHTWQRLDDGKNTTALDTQDGTMKYELDLAALLAKEGSEFNHNGATHVAEAHKLIAAERRKLAVLLDTEQLPASQAQIWQRVQEILLTRVFNADLGDGNTDTFAARLPDEVNDGYDKDSALDTIDQILTALSSADDLEAALDEDETALFVEDDKPFVSHAANRIFNQRELQVLAWSGQTDFTRFGVWRVRRSRNGEHVGNWVNGEMDTFAYSPLDASKITSTSAPGYPAGSVATYEGSTVAWVDTVGHEGDVTVNVRWNGPLALVGGSLTLVLSNLVTAAEGDPLTHNNNGAAYEVRELVFPSLAFGTNAQNELVFSGDNRDVSVLYQLRNATNGTISAASWNGTFVGSSSDGPLGVLGRYELPADNDNDAIKGAFGADLP